MVDRYLQIALLHGLLRLHRALHGVQPVAQRAVAGAALGLVLLAHGLHLLLLHLQAGNHARRVHVVEVFRHKPDGALAYLLGHRRVQIGRAHLHGGAHPVGQWLGRALRGGNDRRGVVIARNQVNGHVLFDLAQGVNERQQRLVIAAGTHHIAAHDHGVNALAVEHVLPGLDLPAHRRGVQVADMQNGKALIGLVQRQHRHLFLHQAHTAVGNVVH